MFIVIRNTIKRVEQVLCNELVVVLLVLDFYCGLMLPGYLGSCK